MRLPGPPDLGSTGNKRGYGTHGEKRPSVFKMRSIIEVGAYSAVVVAAALNLNTKSFMRTSVAEL